MGSRRKSATVQKEGKMPTLIPRCSFGVFLLLSALLAQGQNLRVRQTSTVDGEAVSVTETSIKGSRQRIETESPTGTTIVLRQCDLKRSVTLNDQNQTYTVANDVREGSASESGGSITQTVVVTDTGRRRPTFNVPARRLQTKVTVESSRNACTQIHQSYEVDGWYVEAPKEQAACGPALPPVRVTEGCNDAVVRRISGNGKLGFPLLEWITVHNGDDADTIVVVRTRSVHTEELEQAFFEIPPGYQEAN
jgi:hypothetical protein